MDPRGVLFQVFAGVTESVRNRTVCEFLSRGAMDVKHLSNFMCLVGLRVPPSTRKLDAVPSSEKIFTGPFQDRV
jgi:hypothetical protein